MKAPLKGFMQTFCLCVGIELSAKKNIVSASCSVLYCTSLSVACKGKKCLKPVVRRERNLRCEEL